MMMILMMDMLVLVLVKRLEKRKSEVTREAFWGWVMTVPRRTGTRRSQRLKEKNQMTARGVRVPVRMRARGGGGRVFGAEAGAGRVLGIGGV